MYLEEREMLGVKAYLEEREMLGVKAVLSLVLFQRQQLDESFNELSISELVKYRPLIIAQLVPRPTLHRLVLNRSILQHLPESTVVRSI